MDDEAPPTEISSPTRMRVVEAEAELRSTVSGFRTLRRSVYLLFGCAAVVAFWTSTGVGAALLLAGFGVVAVKGLSRSALRSARRELEEARSACEASSVEPTDTE